MKGPLLSVVIPAYNEEARLGPTLERILSYLTSRHLPAEILVVDDGSRDATAQVAAAAAARPSGCCTTRLLCNERNRGKGYSVRRGMLEAQGSYALLTDADLSAPIEEMPKLERYVMEGPFDIAMGSRDVEGSQVEVHQSRLREGSGKIYNRLMRLVTGLPYGDTQCGFKLFDMRRCRDIFRKQRIEDFGFDVEIIYLARKWGLSVKEVPVVWRHVPGSRVRFVPDAVQMALDLVRIRRNDRAGRYERGGSAAA